MRIAFHTGGIAPAVIWLIICIGTGNASAQSKFARPELAQPSPKPVTRLAVPPAETLVLLTRITLLTLHDAIATGNYSVLRDRGGPSFRRANRPADLARAFAPLEAQQPDLAAVATATPTITAAQIVGAEQRLLLKGHYHIQAVQIGFELLFEPAEGQWQVFSLSAGILAPTEQSSSQAQPSAAAR